MVDYNKLVDEIMAESMAAKADRRVNERLDKSLQLVAEALDKILTQAGGTTVPFGLFVFTSPPQYVSNVRPDSVESSENMIEHMLRKWRAGARPRAPGGIITQ